MRARDALRATARYLKDHPRAVAKAVTDATKLRFGIPVSALAWVATQAKPRKNGPTEVELAAVPPALRFAASVEAMGTPIRFSGAVRVDDVFIAADTIRVGLRLNEVTLTVLGGASAPADSPVAMLIRSGALDLSKPGNVVKFLPKRPAFIVDAGGDRIVLDLLKVPALLKNAKLQRALAVLSPVISIRAIDTDGDHIYVTLRATPRGVGEALGAALKKPASR